MALTGHGCLHYESFLNDSCVFELSREVLNLLAMLDACVQHLVPEFLVGLSEDFVLLEQGGMQTGNLFKCLRLLLELHAEVLELPDDFCLKLLSLLELLF